MQDIVIKTLSTEELETQRLELSKKVSSMLSTGCATIFLRELCDQTGYDVSYRQKLGYIWCFFRWSDDTDILYTSRADWSWPDAKRYASHLILQKLKSHTSKIDESYDYKVYNPSMILLLSMYSREIARRSPLHATSAVLEIAHKKKMNIKWNVEKSATSYSCWCAATYKYTPFSKIIRTPTVNVSFKIGAMDEAKKLASTRMLEMLKYV
ncbi:MAG: hypothetical protein AABZ74_02040 [Cyanobacteriota bacterium]